MTDAMRQLLHELQVERHSRPLPDWKDPSHHRPGQPLPAWTPAEIAEHRAVAHRESLAYGRAHPEGVGRNQGETLQEIAS